MSRASGRIWAYAGIVLGGAVSLAANYAHIRAAAGRSGRVNTATGRGRRRTLLAVMIFVAVEILVRTAWPRRYRWHALRYLGLQRVASPE